MLRRHAISDPDWARIKDFLPGKAGDPGVTAAVVQPAPQPPQPAQELELKPDIPHAAQVVLPMASRLDQTVSIRGSGTEHVGAVDAVLWIAKTGSPWRDLPERFGNWNSVWRRFDRWARKGVWERIFRELGDSDLEWLLLDSTVIRAHQHAAGAKKGALK